MLRPCSVTKMSAKLRKSRWRWVEIDWDPGTSALHYTELSRTLVSKSIAPGWTWCSNAIRSSDLIIVRDFGHEPELPCLHMHLQPGCEGLTWSAVVNCLIGRQWRRRRVFRLAGRVGPTRFIRRNPVLAC
jgi:hypothetical protein